MIRPLLLLAPLLLIAADAPGFVPGQWQRSVEVSVATINGQPAQGAKGNIPLLEADAVCLGTIPAPQAVLQDRLLQDCRVASLDVKGGAITLAAECDMPGATLHIEGHGTATPTGYALELSGQGGTPRTQLTVTGHASGRRLGDCPAAR
jgi:hypothetical protein